jgi:ABC-type nitrate/sulfonate/bicarbonate transport system substrate-binding protein
MGQLRRTDRLVVLIIGLAAAVSACAREAPGTSGPRQQVRFGLALQPPSALAIIALQEGFFDEAGLDVTVSEYVSGKRALGGLLAGQVDVATMAEVPIVFAAFERRDFAILATIGSVTNEQRIVARRDRGIADPADLRGKVVATQKASAVHFFLHLFLIHNGLSGKDVAGGQIRYMKAEDLPPALADGSIDAFSMREPYVSQAVGLLGRDNVRVFAEPGLYFRTEQLLGRKAFLGEHPPVAVKMIRALLRAEEMARADPNRAVAVVAERLGVAPAVLASGWDDFELQVTLDQAILTSMEDEARWALNEQLVEGDRVPNFLKVIDTTALDELKRSAVTIIR